MFRPDICETCVEPPEDGGFGLANEGEGGVGLKGPKHGIQERRAINYYKSVN